MRFLHTTLGNGLQIVAECNDQAYSTAVGFFVQTGARDETADVAGVSHFLEHMVFKGTPARGADDVNREFDEMGADYNAFTSEESTVYYAAVLPEYQQRAVALLADLMRPALRAEDFATEKQVIIEEIRMYEDQPPFGADDKCKAAFFGDHPLGHSVLGTEQSIRDLSVEAMRRYFASRYSPQNIVLAAAGNVDFDDLTATVERLTAKWEAFLAPRDIAPATTHKGFRVVQKAAATQEYVLRMTPGPTATDADRYAAKVLATIIGDDSGSRLYWELIDPGLAEHASMHHGDYHGAGMFMTYVSCSPERIADNLWRMDRLLRGVEAEGVAATELQQAKSKINSRLVLRAERPRGRLFNIGANWTYRGEYRSLAEDLAQVEALTVDDLHAVLAKYPLSSGMTYVVGPLAEGDLEGLDT